MRRQPTATARCIAYLKEEGHTLPLTRIVCPCCNGRGGYVNPAIDGNGLSRDDMDAMGPDFMDDYLGGVYDITCEECGGRNVIEVLDERRASRETIGLWNEWMDDEAEYRAERAAEIRAGC